MKLPLLLLLLVGLSTRLPAQTRTSASYALGTESLDSGGGHATGGPYAHEAVAGVIGFAGVLLGPTEPTAVQNPVGLVPRFGDPVIVRFIGTPSLQYAIQWTDSLIGPVWHDLTTVGPDADGVFQASDTGSQPARYYRAVSR